MNDMSITLGELPIGCCSGNTVINHLIYADDIVLFAPSEKGVQSLLDVCSSYAMRHDIIFNCDKSKLMFIDTRKSGIVPRVTLGNVQLGIVNTYRYLGHIMSDDLSDELDMKSKVRCLYARSNMLASKFRFCTNVVKNRLFTSFCSNVCLCWLWARFRQSVMHTFVVAFNNAFRIIHRLPMRCSASYMFAEAGVDNCTTRRRKCIYNLMCRIDSSSNGIVHDIAMCDIHLTSALSNNWRNAVHLI